MKNFGIPPSAGFILNFTLSFYILRFTFYIG
jgi:hypothetical protein